LNEQRKLNISVHNAEVRENREILKDLINVNYFPDQGGTQWGVGVKTSP